MKTVCVTTVSGVDTLAQVTATTRGRVWDPPKERRYGGTTSEGVKSAPTDPSVDSEYMRELQTATVESQLEQLHKDHVQETVTYEYL